MTQTAAGPIRPQGKPLGGPGLSMFSPASVALVAAELLAPNLPDLVETWESSRKSRAEWAALWAVEICAAVASRLEAVQADPGLLPSGGKGIRSSPDGREAWR